MARRKWSRFISSRYQANVGTFFVNYVAMVLKDRALRSMVSAEQVLFNLRECVPVPCDSAEPYAIETLVRQIAREVLAPMSKTI